MLELFLSSQTLIIAVVSPSPTALSGPSLLTVLLRGTMARAQLTYLWMFAFHGPQESLPSSRWYSVDKGVRTKERVERRLP